MAGQRTAKPQSADCADLGDWKKGIYPQGNTLSVFVLFSGNRRRSSKPKSFSCWEGYLFGECLALLDLVFRPSRFVTKAASQSIQQEFQTNEQLRKAFPGEKLPPEKMREFEMTELERTTQIPSAWFWAILLTVASVFAGWTLGWIVNWFWPNPWLPRVFQITAAGVLLSATLGQLRWEIQSYKGKTLPERANRWLFRGAYVLGTSILVASIAL